MSIKINLKILKKDKPEITHTKKVWEALLFHSRKKNKKLVNISNDNHNNRPLRRKH